MKDYSQYEEYKLVERALEVIGVYKNGWCVDFGAGDGMDCSNSYNLIHQNKFSSVQIEPSKEEFEILKRRYADNTNVYTINDYVGLDIENGLHVLLKQTPCPLDFDFLSIDIDGNDIYAWSALHGYKPKLVLIEFNPSFPPHIDWRQPCDLGLQQGCSLLATVNVGKELGYELVGVTQINALFARKDLYPLFQMEDNSIECLYDNSAYVTTLAQLYDGRLVVLGNRMLLWHRIEIDEDSIQILPKDLQSYKASIKVRCVANKRVVARGVAKNFKSGLPWYSKK